MRLGSSAAMKHEAVLAASSTGCAISGSRVRLRRSRPSLKAPYAGDQVDRRRVLPGTSIDKVSKLRPAVSELRLTAGFQQGLSDTVLRVLHELDRNFSVADHPIFRARKLWEAFLAQSLPIEIDQRSNAAWRSKAAENFGQPSPYYWEVHSEGERT